MKNVFTALSVIIAMTYLGYTNVAYAASAAEQPVDVLIVIDDSGSMAIHQQNLLKHAKSLSQHLTALKNGHVGVLSTSVENQDEAGMFKAAWLETQAADFQKKLEEQITLGTSGSGKEQPFEAISSFYAAKDNGNNQGFWRAEANLNVVLLTDAEDQSAQFSSGFDFAQALVNLKGQKYRKIGFHGLIIPSSVKNETCARDQPDLLPARIEDVIQIFAGITVGLCDSEAQYESGLAKIGQAIKTHLIP